MGAALAELPRVSPSTIIPQKRIAVSEEEGGIPKMNPAQQFYMFRIFYDGIQYINVSAFSSEHLRRPDNGWMFYENDANVWKLMFTLCSI